MLKVLTLQRLETSQENGPLVARESLSLYNFTLQHNFSLVIAYHTQGKEIYWQFQNYTPAESREIANIFANVSGYTVSDTPYNSSFAGYKDWFIQDYRRPGFTIEAGIGENPLPITQFNTIYNDNIRYIIIRRSRVVIAYLNYALFSFYTVLKLQYVKLYYCK